MVGVRKKAAFAQTTEDFASRTSIHGVAYVFDRTHGLVDRVLWFLVVFGLLALCTFFTANSWIQWRNEQVEMKYFAFQQLEAFLNRVSQK